MKINKTFCDVCGKEIDHMWHPFKITGYVGSAYTCIVDVIEDICPDCDRRLISVMREAYQIELKIIKAISNSGR